MKQTNNWEEKLDKIYWKDDFDYKKLKTFIHQELTNLLKTVAEAMVEEPESIFKKTDSSNRQLVWDSGYFTCRSQIISNISEKYPEFREMTKLITNLVERV